MFAKSYASYYNRLHNDKPYADEIAFVYAWADKPKSIFDIGCGTAQYWQYYPGGTQIRGIDKSIHMANNNPHIEHADIMQYTPKGKKYEAATMLFNVLNYIPKLSWFDNIPVKRGGFVIFDIYDKKKVDADGFHQTFKKIGNIYRLIQPITYDGRISRLSVSVYCQKDIIHEEHKMFIHSMADIEKACGKTYEIAEVKHTPKWQTWVKLIRK